MVVLGGGGVFLMSDVPLYGLQAKTLTSCSSDDLVMNTEASSQEHACVKSTLLSFITRRGAPDDSALPRPLTAHKVQRPPPPPQKSEDVRRSLPIH